ncbi:MAG TPA: sulfatase [Opitutaceae bacterium]|nr:sulfatase [Opitutaceae bacterium]
MKTLLFFVVCLATAAGISTTGFAADATKSPPNIVFIFSDDHAWQAISAYGDARKLNETPNIDRIAKNGMRFDRCLVPNPLCGPSRACVLTGTYNHINGFVNNSNCAFDGSQVTFPKLLQRAGYQTAIIGKWHLETDPTGFDFWQILPGQGIYYNPPMIRNGEKVQTEGYVTDIITDLSLDWLKNRDRKKPFLLMMHHKAPHRWWEPALRDLDADHGRHYDEPPTLFDDYSGRGPAVHDQDMTIAHTLTDRDLKLIPMVDLTPEERKRWDEYYGPRNAEFRKQNLKGDDLVRWKYQRYLHDYLACIRAVDDSVGRVLDYLDAAGLAENTIVVYASDQGFFMGEHGWFDKRWIFEESMKTPFVVRWPAVIKPGSVNTQIVSNIDFAETFLDAAGVAVPSEMQGRSLLPLFKDEHTDWRTSFYFQYFEYPEPHRVRPHFGVVTDRYKLVHYFGPGGDDYTELYDRVSDPREMKDVAKEAKYADTKADLEKELTRLRKELKVPDEVPAYWFGGKRPESGKL